MTPISLMPPVDYCPSCEGRKAENLAQQVGAARAEQTDQGAAADPTAPSVGAPPPIDAGAQTPAGNEARPINGTVQTLLAPDLAVQALQAQSQIGETGSDEAALRLRGADAYGTGNPAAFGG